MRFIPFDKINKFWKYSLLVVGLIFLVLGFFFFRYQPSGPYEWGLTFSPKEAQGLGFDWKVMYLDILSDLKPKKLRLMADWEEIGKDRGKYDFTMIDQMLTEADKRGIQVLLVVGRKQPRWPECHEPSWYESLSTADREAETLEMIKNTVEHLKSYKNITAWQVENEPYFGFGDDCPKLSPDLMKREVSLVKQTDSRPVLMTDSGDRGGWFGVMRAGADDFGFTLYRVSFDAKYGGYYKYPLPPVFYRIRAGILKTFTHVDNISDVELQMEPWFTNGALNMPVDEQKALMNPKVFAENIRYAEGTGIRDHYLWGVEWWYWMAKKNNDWGMWGAAKDLFSK